MKRNVKKWSLASGMDPGESPVFLLLGRAGKTTQAPRKLDTLPTSAEEARLSPSLSIHPEKSLTSVSSDTEPDISSRRGLLFFSLEK